MRVNFVCCKWGTRYSAEYVNRLYRMCLYNTPMEYDVHFYCYTDNSEGFEDEIKVIDFPDIPDIHPKYWFETDDFKYGMARCWDRPKTFIFNTHNFADDKPTGRFVFFDLDVIIQGDLSPIITYDLENPRKLRSWWQDPRPMKSRNFKLAHGAYTNGSCMVWSDDQTECIWQDVLEHQERIWFTFTDGTDNYHSWRWGDFRPDGKPPLWKHFPNTFAYSYNRGRDWKEKDLEVAKYRKDCILCVFNVDILPHDDGTRGKVKQDKLIDDQLLAHWNVPKIDRQNPVDINIYTVKWGEKYSSEYVNKIFDQCKNKTKYKFDFYCLTEDPVGLSEGIKIVPLPENNKLEKWWNKMYLFDKTIVQQRGEKLFLDLDLIIQHDIDPFIEHDPEDSLCFIKTQWHDLEQMRLDTREIPHTYTDLNSSVLRWNDNLDVDKITALVKNYTDQMLFYYRGIDNLFGHKRDRLAKIKFFAENLVYSYNNGYRWPEDTEKRVIRPDPIICIFDSMGNAEDIKN